MSSHAAASRFDTLIAGGGPAGTATAIALAQRNRRAIVVEASAYTAWRVGETLPAVAKSVLAQLEIDASDLKNVTLASHAVQSAWGHDDLHEQHSLFNPYGTGLHLDRRRFDILLAAEAERRGATVLRGARLASLEHSAAGFVAHIRTAGGVRRIEAPVAVDATGRSAALARTQGCRRVEYDRLVGVAGVLRPRSRRSRTAHILLLEAAEHGFWYSVPLPGGALLATFMTDADFLTSNRNHPTDHWASHLRQTTHTARRARDFSLAGKVHVRKAESSYLVPVAGTDWLAAGDAASTFDPLSSDGIRKALHGGVRAAHAIDEHLKGSPEAFLAYAREVERAFSRFLEQRIDHYAMEARWPDSLFWRRRRPPDWHRTAITLDPELIVRGQKGMPARSAAELEGILPYRELARLHRLSLAAPLQAHILLRSFLDTCALPLPDGHGILALQVLMERGLVTPCQGQ